MKRLVHSNLTEIEQLVISGNSQKARQLLRATAPSNIPRKELALFASLCRRVNLPLISVRVLNPLVRPVGKKEALATTREITEYAAALTYLGATEESNELLKRVNVQEEPQSLLFQAFSYFARWDYGSALPFLKQYIEMASISDYQRIIGKVNLVAALVYERKHSEAEPLLKELLQTTNQQKLQLLNGNLWEISAQNEIFQKSWSSAKKHLKKSFDVLHRNLGAGYIYVTKWETLLAAMETHDKKSRKKLFDFKEKMKNESHWEIQRDCERYEAIIFQDEPLLNRVCFGTPYPKFVENTLSLFDPSYSLPHSFQWEVFPGKQALEFDLNQGKLIHKKTALKAGQGMHRLLSSLCSDFYRPLRIAVIHHHIFPNEFYNPISAPKRVHEKIRFLRLWLHRCKIPLSVRQKNRFYFLEASKPLQITIRSAPRQTTTLTPSLTRLKELLPLPFTSSQVAKALSISMRSAVRLISVGIKTQNLTSQGKGRSTRYHWI